jgi:hypothetical protein
VVPHQEVAGMAGTWYSNTFDFPLATSAVTPYFYHNMITPPNTGMTLRRTRLEVEFDVSGVTDGAATGFDINWWPEVTINVGVILTHGVGTAPNPPDPKSSPAAIDWIIWDTLNLRVQTYDLSTPYLLLSAFPPEGALESFAGRIVSTTDVSAIWLVWNVTDPVGLIGTHNTTTHIFYEWGYRAGLRCLFEPTVT